MPSTEHSATPWHRIGYAPFLTLAATIPFVVFSSSPPLSRPGWEMTAVLTASVFIAFQLLEVFVRQGERRGAPRKQMRTIGFGVFVATVSIAYVVRGLWSHGW